MRSPARRLLALFALAVLVPGVWATTALKLSTQEMVDQAEVIAIGRYVDARSQWVEGTLVTLVTLSVGETLKGPEGSFLTVALPGGIDASRAVPVAVTWPGAPTIMPSEEVFVFLNADQTVGGGMTIVGFSQGKFSVASDAKGRKYVTRDLRGLNLLSDNGSARGKASVVPLEDFKAEVKSLVDRGRQ